MRIQEILAAVQEYIPTPDLEVIRRAHAFAMRCHKGHTRVSGEPYITHLQEVAFLATKLHLDEPSIVTALIHDTVEDTETTLDEIAKEFGKPVAELVDGVTKLSQVKFSSRAEAQAENFRKMLLAMAKDIRVLLIKLCDRVHNMRTLEFLSESRRQRIAQETLDIYAPLAHRMGIYWMKSELEDMCLRYLKPAVYENIKQHVSTTKRERESYINEVVRLITRELNDNNIKGEVLGRPKHFYSIFQKMERDHLNFDEIYDLIAFRIVVPTTMDCYASVGVVHAAWKPIPGRFKDYIAMPKPNRYQSLHTTVIGPKGHRIEIQIRTPEMHKVAERGIAAHWVYKESGGAGTLAEGAKAFQFGWLKDLVESEKLLRDPVEFIATVKQDLFPQEVFIFSPRGDLIALTSGATPIDFAYHIHSEIGHKCSGARVNGQQVPLSYKLQNGDTVEISTTENHTPGKDWLNLVVTSKAKQRIRAWLRTEARERSLTVGKEVLSKDLRKVRLSLSSIQKDGSLEKIAKDLAYKEIDSLFADIGYGKVSTRSIVARLLPNDQDIETKLGREDSALQKIFQKAAKAFKDRSSVKVHGMDDLVFRFARCCEPLPGDELVGFITRGRGVAVHSRSCPQTLGFDPRRIVPVSWDDSVKTLRPVKLTVICMNQLGLLASLTQTISGAGANIVSAQVSSNVTGKAECNFQLTVESSSQLNNLVRKIEQITGIIKVERFKGL